MSITRVIAGIPPAHSVDIPRKNAPAQRAEAFMIRSFIIFLSLQLLTGAALAQIAPAPDVPEPRSVEAIAAAT
ncbi:MAG TPA: hypothetical protein VET69_10980, partial [Terriglobales bacterium]|nr:hypothetical protein [Terriglobales bacterium]